MFRRLQLPCAAVADSHTSTRLPGSPSAAQSAARLPLFLFRGALLLSLSKAPTATRAPGFQATGSWAFPLSTTRDSSPAEAARAFAPLFAEVLGRSGNRGASRRFSLSRRPCWVLFSPRSELSHRWIAPELEPIRSAAALNIYSREQSRRSRNCFLFCFGLIWGRYSEQTNLPRAHASRHHEPPRRPSHSRGSFSPSRVFHPRLTVNRSAGRCHVVADGREWRPVAPAVVEDPGRRFAPGNTGEFVGTSQFGCVAPAGGVLFSLSESHSLLVRR